MNILFVNYNYPDSNFGGAGRAIINISNFLITKGFNVYVAFFEGDTLKNILFKNDIKISSKSKSLKELSNFLVEHNIQKVINFTWGFSPVIIKTIKGTSCKFISSFNEDPLYFYKTTQNLIKNKRYYYEPQYKLRRFLSVFYKLGAIGISNYKKRVLFNNSDRYIVLSKHFKEILINQYKLGVLESMKILSIYNSLSYPSLEDNSNKLIKEKRVLIVSRMDDLVKRLTLALDLWNNAFKMLGDNEWQLDIVGGGHEKNKITKFAADNGIRNVNFFDAQEPKPFYARSKIFMMTSCSEGFGLTLTESQQFGCIPIAFNSYDALPEIIIDNENGFIIEEGDLKGYVNKLVELMKNPERLDKMIEPTIESTKRFDISIIGPQWLEVINNR